MEILLALYIQFLVSHSNHENRSYCINALTQGHIFWNRYSTKVLHLVKMILMRAYKNMILHFDISKYLNENSTQCTPNLTKMRCRVLMYISNIHYLCHLMGTDFYHIWHNLWWNTNFDNAMLIQCLMHSS